MSVSGAVVAWQPDIPEVSKDYKCFRLYMGFRPDYLLEMDARGVDSICANKDDPSLPLYQQRRTWARLFLHFDDFSSIEPDGTTRWVNKGGKSVYAWGPWGDERDFGTLYTPYFVNCCPDSAAVGFDIELTMHTLVGADGGDEELDVVMHESSGNEGVRAGPMPFAYVLAHVSSSFLP